jgi:hypothetical protein
MLEGLKRNLGVVRIYTRKKLRKTFPKIFCMLEGSKRNIGMGRVTVVRNKDILKVSPRYEAHQAQLGS